MVKTCPHCGSVLPDNIPVNGKIERKIFEIVRKHPGIITKDLMDYVYADRADGGPTCNTVSVIICRMNKTLKALGIKIHAGMGSRGGYSLIKIENEGDSR